jgi:Protein of unknown function (DUF3592)
MSNPTIPPELNQPLPRPVRWTVNFKSFVTVLTVLFLFPLLALLGSFYGISHNRAVLRANGVPVVGQITDLKVERGKSTDSYRVGYQFQPSAMPTGRHRFQTSDDYVSEARYRTLQVGQAVPILYEPTRPGNSGLHFDDSVNTSDDSAMMLPMTVLIVGLFGGIYSLLMAILLIPSFRKKKLLQWGRVAPAVILKEEEISGRPPTMTATYQFTDEGGQTVVGIQKNLPSAKKLDWPGFRVARDAVTKNPIALYRPGNSRESMLYGAGFLICYVPA